MMNNDQNNIHIFQNLDYIIKMFAMLNSMIVVIAKSFSEDRLY
jgi:hypothetical protein